MNHPWLQIKSTLITINNTERQRPMATNDGRSRGALLKFKGSGAISPSTPFSGGRSHLYLAGTGPGHWYNDLSLPTSRPRSQGCNSSGRRKSQIWQVFISYNRSTYTKYLLWKWFSSCSGTISQVFKNILLKLSGINNMTFYIFNK